MGWATDTYKEVYKAYISNENMEVDFKRLYTDARDIMCDSPKPYWEAVDDFIITVTKLRTWVETKEEDFTYSSGEPGHLTTTVKHTDRVESFEIRTKSKDAANRIWWLAKNQKVTYEDIKAANKAKMFN